MTELSLHLAWFNRTDGELQIGSQEEEAGAHVDPSFLSHSISISALVVACSSAYTTST